MHLIKSYFRVLLRITIVIRVYYNTKIATLYCILQTYIYIIWHAIILVRNTDPIALYKLESSKPREIRTLGNHILLLLYTLSMKKEPSQSVNSLMQGWGTFLEVKATKMEGNIEYFILLTKQVYFIVQSYIYVYFMNHPSTIICLWKRWAELLINLLFSRNVLSFLLVNHQYKCLPHQEKYTNHIREDFPSQFVVNYHPISILMKLYGACLLLRTMHNK